MVADNAHYRPCDIFADLPIIENLVNLPFMFVTLSIQQTIEKLRAGCSLARFGDGELCLFRGIDINSGTVQRFDPLLVAAMARVLADPPERMLIGLVERRPAEWRFFQSLVKKEGVLLCDAELFRAIQDQAESYLSEIKSIWNERDVVLVNFNPILLEHDLFANARSRLFVPVSQQNCFSHYDGLLNDCKKLFGRGLLFLASCGPAAKILALDLCRCGEHCLDIGQAARAYNARNRIRYRHLMSRNDLREKEPDDYFREDGG